MSPDELKQVERSLGRLEGAQEQILESLRKVEENVTRIFEGQVEFEKGCEAKRNQCAGAIYGRIKAMDETDVKIIEKVGVLTARQKIVFAVLAALGLAMAVFAINGIFGHVFSGGK